MFSILLALGQVVMARLSRMSGCDIFYILLNQFELALMLLQAVLDLFGDVCSIGIWQRFLACVVNVVRLEGGEALDEDEGLLDGGLQRVYSFKELLMQGKRHGDA